MDLFPIPYRIGPPSYMSWFITASKYSYLRMPYCYYSDVHQLS